jgi:hypothetical protein
MRGHLLVQATMQSERAADSRDKQWYVEEGFS